jgi:plastocyanin
MTPAPRALAVLILVLGGAALGGASPVAGHDGGSPDPSAESTPSGGAAISIIDKTFQPAEVTIHVGETVTWTVTRAIDQPHSVTSGTPTDGQPGSLFDSGVTLRNNGDSFSWTFATPGTYPFFCSVHPDTMTGTVTVLADGGAEGEHPAVDTSSKLIAVGLLVVALVILLGWAALYRRLNAEP